MYLRNVVSIFVPGLPSRLSTSDRSPYKLCFNLTKTLFNCHRGGVFARAAAYTTSDNNPWFQLKALMCDPLLEELLWAPARGARETRFLCRRSTAYSACLRTQATLSAVSRLEKKVKKTKKELQYVPGCVRHHTQQISSGYLLPACYTVFT